MKSRKLPVLLATGVLSAALAGSAFGQSTEFGSSVPLSHPHDRQITIKPGAKYVNVTRGECVEFVLDGKPFAWNFDIWDTGNFDLARIAPNEAAAAGVRVYVGPNYQDRYR